MDSEDLLIPSQVGNYRLESKIGRGSSSIVWKGIADKSSIPVAIKIIPKIWLDSELKLNKFRRELYLLQQMDHPFIVQFYQMIEDDKFYYLVLEYVQNGSLRDYVENKGPLPEGLARRIYVQMYVALKYLHQEKLIVHRDIKAENILLDSGNNIRIIDFGLGNQFSVDQPELNTLCGSMCMFLLGHLWPDFSNTNTRLYPPRNDKRGFLYFSS